MFLRRSTVRQRLGAVEERTRGADGEVRQLRENIAKYEALVLEYKEQIRRAQTEAAERNRGAAEKEAALIEQRTLYRELAGRLETQVTLTDAYAAFI